LTRNPESIENPGFPITDFGNDKKYAVVLPVPNKLQLHVLNAILMAMAQLKPERTPLEANLWGTPKSSGSFSTLFQSRLLKALDYRQNPFDLRVERVDRKMTGSKVFGLSRSLGTSISESFKEFDEKDMDACPSRGKIWGSALDIGQIV